MELAHTHFRQIGNVELYDKENESLVQLITANTSVYDFLVFKCIFYLAEIMLKYNFVF